MKKGKITTSNSILAKAWKQIKAQLHSSQALRFALSFEIHFVSPAAQVRRQPIGRPRPEQKSAISPQADREMKKLYPRRASSLCSSAKTARFAKEKKLLGLFARRDRLVCSNAKTLALKARDDLTAS